MTVYECVNNGGIEPLQAYLDDSEAEEFFTIKWTLVESTGAPVLLVAGKLGVIRVFDCNQQALLWVSVLATHVSVLNVRMRLILSGHADSSRPWRSNQRPCSPPQSSRSVPYCQQGMLPQRLLPHALGHSTCHMH